MADLDLTKNSSMVADIRNGRGTPGTTFGTPLNYDSVTTLKTRLAAISGTSYTAARLNSMTKNDLIYALRLNDDTAGVKQWVK